MSVTGVLGQISVGGCGCKLALVGAGALFGFHKWALGVRKDHCRIGH